MENMLVYYLLSSSSMCGCASETKTVVETILAPEIHKVYADESSMKLKSFDSSRGGRRHYEREWAG